MPDQAWHAHLPHSAPAELLLEALLEGAAAPLPPTPFPIPPPPPPPLTPCAASSAAFSSAWMLADVWRSLQKDKCFGDVRIAGWNAKNAAGWGERLEGKVAQNEKNAATATLAFHVKKLRWRISFQLQCWETRITKIAAAVQQYNKEQQLHRNGRKHQKWLQKRHKNTAKISLSTSSTIYIMISNTHTSILLRSISSSFILADTSLSLLRYVSTQAKADSRTASEPGSMRHSITVGSTLAHTWIGSKPGRRGERGTDGADGADGTGEGKQRCGGWSVVVIGDKRGAVWGAVRIGLFTSEKKLITITRQARPQLTSVRPRSHYPKTCRRLRGPPQQHHPRERQKKRQRHPLVSYLRTTHTLTHTYPSRSPDKKELNAIPRNG